MSLIWSTGTPNLVFCLPVIQHKWQAPIVKFELSVFPWLWCCYGIMLMMLLWYYAMVLAFYNDPMNVQASLKPSELTSACYCSCQFKKHPPTCLIFPTCQRINPYRTVVTNSWQQNNSYWTARNYEILSRYTEIIITTFWYHLQPLATVA